MAEECVFCRIVAGDVPAETVHRDDHVVAFRDLSPKAELHVLVVPRLHLADVTELARQPELLAAVVRAGASVAASLSDGQFRLVFNTGSGAGQTVFHVHGHVLAGAGRPPSGSEVTGR